MIRLSLLLCVALAGSLVHAAPPPAQPEALVTVDMAFCVPPPHVRPLHAETDCKLIQKPIQEGPLQAWLRIYNVSSEPQRRTLVVSPYYHHTVEIYRLESGTWVLVETGGASLGGHASSASLGGHRFAFTLPTGETQVLVRIPRDPSAPKVTHFRAALEDSDNPFNKEQVLLGLHIGMLQMVFLLMLMSWAVERSVLQFRLMLLTAATLLCVLIGSGALYLIWPSASPHWWGTVIFGASIVIRIACLGWIYDAMVQPFQKDRKHHRLTRGLYATTWIAVAAFFVNWPLLGWILSIVLLLAVSAISAFGLHAAVDMPPRLRRILQLSLAGFFLLNFGGFIGMMLTQGQNNVPVYISRLIDLGLPLGALVMTLLRNKVLAQEYQRTKETLTRQTIALESERQTRNEKRMLLDMLTHEIKNPLASINFALTTLSQSQEGQQGQTPRRLENISRSVQTIDQIIEHCNLANGIEDKRIQPQMACTDLTRMFQELLGPSPQADRFVLDLNTSFQVKTDVYLLKMIAANLIDNAIKYAPINTPICIQAFGVIQADSQNWGFQIRNALTHDMVPDPEQIFERYYRHPLAQELRGSGLGLSICRQICHLLGGRIHYRCDEVSITFEVCFEST
jgi:signal transduction histidine kinase